jgi:hypothetical protein
MLNHPASMHQVNCLWMPVPCAESGCASSSAHFSTSSGILGRAAALSLPDTRACHPILLVLLRASNENSRWQLPQVCCDVVEQIEHISGAHIFKKHWLAMQCGLKDKTLEVRWASGFLRAVPVPAKVEPVSMAHRVPKVAEELKLRCLVEVTVSR